MRVLSVLEGKMVCSTGVVNLAVVCLVSAAAAIPIANVNRQSLRRPALQRLPTGATKPLGWLKDELQLQADGLSGQLPYFWSYFTQSPWVNDQTHGGLAQFIPYYINGLFPLSYQLEDPNLQKIRDRIIDHVLSEQNISYGAGWLGPIIPNSSSQSEEYWTKYLAIEAFESYAEASPQNASRVIKALMAHHRQLFSQMTSNEPPFNRSRWGFARYSDAIAGIQWLLDRTQPTAENEFLWDLLSMIRTQSDVIMASIDHDWEEWFRSGNPFDFKGMPFNNSDDSNDHSGTVHLLRHGVDIGQAIKTGALWWRVGGLNEDLENPSLALNWVEKYLHRADGMYWADENVRGQGSPSRGTETCSVVETMFSMRIAYEITGNITFMDRLERIAFNALPAALWPDATANVYHHANNQIKAESHPWVHQGWPKFVLSAVHTDADVVVISGYAPSESVLPSGLTVTISDGYPFSDNVSVQVSSGAKLRFRIPCWVVNATLSFGGVLKTAEACTFVNISVDSASTISVLFNNDIRIYTWEKSNVPNQTAVLGGGVEVHRGALLYALRPASDVKAAVVNGSYPNIMKRSVTIKQNETWNYGIFVNSLEFVQGSTIPTMPFDSDAPAPVMISVEAQQVETWGGSSGGVGVMPLPHSPLSSSAPHTQLRLVPYGSTNIRISVFPQLCTAGTPGCPIPTPAPTPILPPNGVMNLNEPDHDIQRFALNEANATLCWEKCLEYNKQHVGDKILCTVYTYSATSPGHPNQPFCWLKSSANPVQDEGFISGVCREGTSFPCPIT